MLRPTSSGFVKLRSRVPTAKPRILHNYLVSDEDRATMVAGLRRCLEIAAQPAIADITTGAYGVPSGEDDASLIAHIERNTTTLYHPWAPARWVRWSIPSCVCSASTGCG